MQFLDDLIWNQGSINKKVSKGDCFEYCQVVFTDPSSLKKSNIWIILSTLRFMVMCNLKHDFDVPALHWWAVGNCLSLLWAGTVLEVEMGLAEVENWLLGCCDYAVLGQGPLPKKIKSSSSLSFIPWALKAFGFYGVLLKCTYPRHILNPKTQNHGSEELKGSFTLQKLLIELAEYKMLGERQRSLLRAGKSPPREEAPGSPEGPGQ